VIYLSKLIAGSKRLKALKLYSNLITDEGATHLANVVLGNTTLITLSLAFNPTTEATSALFARVLKSNTVLSSLYLNNIGKFKQEISDCLYYNSKWPCRFSLNNMRDTFFSYE
jgi:Ran GTPase-activating protein (RanGAP) involved in mRNA processing and transport